MLPLRSLVALWRLLGHLAALSCLHSARLGGRALSLLGVCLRRGLSRLLSLRRLPPRRLPLR